MKRRTPPSWLTEAFRQQALAFFLHCGPNALGQPLRLYDGGPACWLKQFDHLERPCSGELEAVHLIGRQRIRNALGAVMPTFAWSEPDATMTRALIELAEWDPRNGVPGCTGHHRRFDSHATPELTVPGLAPPGAFRDFVCEWGLESDAERRFEGIAHVLAREETT